jgi:hypothetical protein
MVHLALLVAAVAGKHLYTPPQLVALVEMPPLLMAVAVVVVTQMEPVDHLAAVPGRLREALLNPLPQIIMAVIMVVAAAAVIGIDF